jgi:hypothetical protein
VSKFCHDFFWLAHPAQIRKREAGARVGKYKAPAKRCPAVGVVEGVRGETYSRLGSQMVMVGSCVAIGYD